MTQTIQASLEPRACTRADVAVEVALELDSGRHVVASENISEGGLFVVFEPPRGIGDKVSVELRLPGLPQPIRVPSTVRWIRPAGAATGLPAGMGLMFEDLPDDAAVVIRQLVEERVPMFWE